MDSNENDFGKICCEGFVLNKRDLWSDLVAKRCVILVFRNYIFHEALALAKRSSLSWIFVIPPLILFHVKL